MLMKWNPYQEIPALQREMNDLFDRTWGRRKSEPTGLGAFIPPVDIRETKNSYIAELDLPGIDLKDITVGLENDVLTVKGERKFEEEQKEVCTTCTERIFGTFVRSFSLPGTADVEKVSASYKNGVLKVTIPKKEEAKPKSIKVEVQ